MATVRRFYLYLVALISLMALMAGLIDLSVGLVRLALNAPPLAIDGVTVAGGDLGLTALVVLISAPIWGLHWWLANRRARALTMAGAPAASLRGRSAERSAATRKAYFYAGRFGALAASAGLAGLLIYELLAPRLHAPAVAGGWPAGPLSLAAGLLVAFLFWLYLYRASRADGDAGHERDAGAGWRRAYDYLGLWLATVAAAAGAVGILQAGLLLAGRILIGGSAGLTAAGDWRIELAAGLAALIVGLPIAVWHWRLADWVVADDPTGSEINSLGRKFALYTLLLGGVAVSVLSIAYLVMVSTLLLLGQPVDDLAAVWERTVAPLLGYLPVGPVLWRIFGRALWNDVAWAPETREAAGLRHFYFYLMAGVLLAAFWWGLQQVLAVALFLALGLEGWAALAGPTTRSTVGLATALCLAAGPAWWWHWSRAQAWVEELAATGRDDRASMMRRLYLYGVIVVAAGVVIVNLVIVVTRAPALLLGPHTQADFGGALVQLGVAIGLALLWWLGYGLVLRADARARAVARGGEEAPGPAAPEAEAGGWAPEADELAEPAAPVPPPAKLADRPAPEPGLPPAGRGDVSVSAAPEQAAVPGPAPLPATPSAIPPGARSRLRGQYTREELAAALAAFEAGRAQAAKPAAAPVEEPGGPAAGAAPGSAPKQEQGRPQADDAAALPPATTAAEAGEHQEDAVALPPADLPRPAGLPCGPRSEAEGDLPRSDAEGDLPRPPSSGGSDAEGDLPRPPSSGGSEAVGEPAAEAVGHLVGAEPSGPPAAAVPEGEPGASADERPAVVVVDGGTGAAGAAVLQALRRGLPDVTLWPIGLNDDAQEAMYRAANGGADGLEAAPFDALDRALVIVGLRGMATAGGLGGEMPPELAAAIAASPARKVVLNPAPSEGLMAWADQVVETIRAAISGR